MVTVFTTRPETIFGTTFIAVSIDNDDLLEKLAESNLAIKG